ncbi:acetylornithine and succinylornithine aminotransferase [Ferroglobus placidus DSM 10642]|uniref:Acetylornithine and succinylornithine aminotransferase n=1 Tax=Ferroglobus placidus (strain DSM 10642 / AEDII12DO) TaxID=589924 RepID=D3S2M8_FERPA|nr:aspartate aminotransferase family protein [Ferroglobus placidus]ADC64558.1 acetylornithine and succinylornithine aminotransferase [Ferroglobus placidus DSM 10642]
MSEIFELEKELLIPFFKRQRVVFVKGEGCWLYDERGKKYLDLVAGIACVSIGHSNKYFIERVKEQLEKLVHVSNLYYTLPQIELAKKLREVSGMDKFFFCNSGTEAVEAAIKLARKATGRKRLVSFTGNFHGRTMGALSLTWKEKFRKPFEPLIGEVVFAEFNNVEDLKKKLSEEVAAVFVEAIQGEAGVYPAKEEFIQEIFELKEKYGFLVVFDEVQTGFGRTGEWFAKDIYNVEPDIIAMAKGIANGFPMGAVGVKDYVAEKVEAGDHGSTFGGNPLACTAALATIEYIEKNKLVENSRRMGEFFKEKLSELGFEADGFGLMIGFDKEKAFDFVSSMLEKGVLVNATSENRIRIVPPLIISREEVEFAVERMRLSR